MVYQEKSPTRFEYIIGFVHAEHLVLQNSSGAILLVDDESDIATLFQYYLESSGYRVKVYNDPLKALSE